MIDLNTFKAEIISRAQKISELTAPDLPENPTGRDIAIAIFIGQEALTLALAANVEALTAAQLVSERYGKLLMQGAKSMSAATRTAIIEQMELDKAAQTELPPKSELN